MVEESRSGEQARVAARSVLANIEGLDREGLPAEDRPQVIRLAQTLSAHGGTGGRLDASATVDLAGELRLLLSPVDGLTASTVRSWLDDIA